MNMPEHFHRAPGKILLWRALEAGKRFNKHSAAVEFGWHVSTADRNLALVTTCPARRSCRLPLPARAGVPGTKTAPGRAGPTPA